MQGPPYCITCRVWAKIVENPVFNAAGQYVQSKVLKPWHCPQCGKDGTNIICIPRDDIKEYTGV